VHLLGYYDEIDDPRDEPFLVDPLSLSCPECELISEVFDSRKHGFDGEQGVNTYVVIEGTPVRFACPRCQATRLVMQANFSYQGYESFDGEMAERLEDYFNTFDITGRCTRCAAVIEITWFECD
jgi:hypothetical protein